MAFVVALFDYGEGATFGTPFSEGDVFRLIEKTNEEWWKVERQDKTIIYVPKQFVEVRDAAPTPAHAPLGLTTSSTSSDSSGVPAVPTSPRPTTLRRAHTTSVVSSSPQARPSNGIIVNMKKVTLAGGKKSTARNWAPLYCVLQDTQLTFYKDKKVFDKTRTQGSVKRKTSQSMGTEAVATYLLDGSTVNIVRDHKRKHVLELVNQMNGTIWVQPETASQFDDFRKMLVSTDVLARDGSYSELQIDDEDEDEDDKDKRVVKKKLQAFFRRRPPLESIQSLVKDQYFGMDLDRLCDREKTQVPVFVEKIVRAIEARGLEHVGIYRLSGNASQVQKIRFKVDQEENVDFNDTNAWDDINVLTGALKLFLRELPEPIIPFASLDDFVSAIQLPADADKAAHMHAHIQRIPPCNYATLNFLLAHLSRVSALGDVNKMLVPNISIVFGPTMMRRDIETPNLAMEMVFRTSVVDLMLREYTRLFA